MATARMVTAPWERIWRRPFQKLRGDIPRSMDVHSGDDLAAGVPKSWIGSARDDRVERVRGSRFEGPAQADRHARLREGFVVSIEIGERLRQIVVRRGRFRMGDGRAPEGLLGLLQVAGAVRGIPQPDQGRELVGPAL